ncbi:hypothetical protein EST38_g13889, partial [Candolleomyces aberdarensis]
MGNILSGVRDIFIVSSILYILFKIHTTPPTYAPHSNASAAPRADSNHVLGNSHLAPPTDCERSVEEDSPSQLATPPVHEEPSGQMDPPAPPAKTGINAQVTLPTDDREYIPQGSRSASRASDVQSQDSGATTRRLSLSVFSNSSNVSIPGARFTIVGGDMTVNNAHHTDLRGIEAVLRRCLRNLPPTVNHNSNNAMVITDALGRTATFPWDIVSTYR